MQFKDETKALVKHFSGRSRRAKLVKNRILVCAKYDNDGKPVKVSPAGEVEARHLYDLTIKEATFLKTWKESAWDLEAAAVSCNVPSAWAKQFAKSLTADNYRKEDERDEILAQIPTKTWITARYTAASLGLEKPDDDQKWGIDRVKEIVVPKTNINVSVGTVLQFPALSPDQEAELRRLGDSIATTGEAQNAA